MVKLMIWLDDQYVDYGIYEKEVGILTLDELTRKGFYVTYTIICD